MIYKTLDMKICLDAETANEMNQQYEETIRSVGQFHPKGDVFFQDGKWHAVIRYECEEKEAETRADEYKLKGIEFRCGDCPFFVLANDKRIKYSLCKKGKKVCYSERACEFLYEQIEKGAWEL